MTSLGGKGSCVFSSWWGALLGSWGTWSYREYHEGMEVQEEWGLGSSSLPQGFS